jgi:hypothetical protein
MKKYEESSTLESYSSDEELGSNASERDSTAYKSVYGCTDKTPSMFTGSSSSHTVQRWLIEYPAIANLTK